MADTPTPKPKRQSDPEAVALATLLKVLTPLTPDTRARVLAYVNGKFAPAATMGALRAGQQTEGNV